MAALPIKKDNVISNNGVVKLSLVPQKKKVRYNKDGTICKRQPNKVAGRSSEVYPITSEEEIKAMIDVFDKHIEEATNANRLWVAMRNKLLFIVGINISLRSSDLCDIKWNFFLNDDMTFRKSYKIQPKKTKKTGKFVTLYFNDAIKKAITDYIEKYPIQDMNDYVFKSREGDSHITSIHLGKVIKDTANEAGIERNICSHSLRKTFGYWVYHNAEDKSNALIILQAIFNHSSPAITSKYIGLTDDEIGVTFNELNLGLDYI